MRPSILAVVLVLPVQVLVELWAFGRAGWSTSGLEARLWVPLALVVVGAFLVWARVRHRVLSRDLVAEVPIPGSEAYRGPVTERVLPPSFDGTFRRRTAIAAGCLLGSLLLLGARPLALETLVLGSLGAVAGAVVFVRLRAGAGALLALPLVGACAVALPGAPGLAGLPTFVVFVFVWLAATRRAARSPHGGHAFDDDGGADEAPFLEGGLYAVAWGSLLWTAPVLYVVAAAPRFSCHSPSKRTEGSAREIRNAASRFRGATEHATECPTVARLVAVGELDTSSVGEREDAWGLPFRIECTDDDVFVASAGHDGLFGTADDVLVPRNQPRLRRLSPGRHALGGRIRQPSTDETRTKRPRRGELRGAQRGVGMAVLATAKERERTVD